MTYLIELANKIIAKPRNKKNKELFKSELKKQANIEELRKIAVEFFSDLDIAIMIYRRITEIDETDVHAYVSMGFAFWLNGRDDLAISELQKAKEIDSGNIDVLNLDATLSDNNEEKIRLYKKMLEKDPENKIAKGKLQELLSE